MLSYTTITYPAGTKAAADASDGTDRLLVRRGEQPGAVIVELNGQRITLDPNAAMHIANAIQDIVIQPFAWMYYKEPADDGA